MSVYTNKRQRSAGQMTGTTPTESDQGDGRSGPDDDGPTDTSAGTELHAEPAGSRVRGVDIEEFARVRLQHSPYRAIRRVGCVFSQGTLTLSGTVPTYHYKQLAQTAVSGISGVEKIINRIDVG